MRLKEDWNNGIMKCDAPSDSDEGGIVSRSDAPSDASSSEAYRDVALAYRGDGLFKVSSFRF